MSAMPRTLPPRLARALCAAAVPVALLAAAATAGAQPSVTASRAEVERLEGDLARLDARVGAVAAEYNAAIDRLEAVRARLLRAREDLSTSEGNLRTGQRLLAQRLRGIYAMGVPTDAELFLSSGSLSAAVDLRRLMDRIAREDAATVSTLTRERARIAALKAELTVQRAASERQAEALAEKRTALDGAVAGRERLLKGAKADLRRAIAAERERRRRAAAAAAAARAQSAGGIPYLPGAAEVAVLPGGVAHVFPVQGGANYGDDWMASRAGGRVHQGIDLFKATGQPLVAVADGTLFRVGWNGLGGWRLWLRDRAGTEFYYAHLSAFAPAAKEGATVTQGTVLGYMGTSGDAAGTPPHVHFEIHPAGGGPVRPYPIVSAWPVVR
ncbi:MAG: peptidoglycan DD-metalloendopeptidase family protein [Thermoleophilia bacterium]|nr:peptidoglycan DD-metalloendopeptidase family protein [Thermoleophilia bacterium]